MTLRLGSAPVSYGVFGDVAPTELPVAPQRLLEAMAEAGYVGSELGPPGFFGTPEQTGKAFSDAGLSVIGSYIPLHLSGSEQVMSADLRALRRTCEELAVAGGPGALAVLADEGDAALVAAPFRDTANRGEGLDASRWEVAVERLLLARDACVAAGVQTTFHPHFATYVSTHWEIDRLLENTDLPLCVDTAHFVLGDADPTTYLRRWADRVNHVHVKDVHLDVLRSAAARGDSDLDAWWSLLACPLGEGDVELSGFIKGLADIGYDRWIVVEQDRAAVDRDSWARVNRDQALNRSWLADRLSATGGWTGLP